MIKNICVYCSSSSAVALAYFEAARQLGELIARSGCILVYGGVNVGLMGEVAQSARIHGGRIVGVIPDVILEKKITFDQADEMVVTADLRERKAVMEERSDAFIALPGGFGTLEEVLEVLTLKQLKYHNKPVVFINTGGFFNPLVDAFEEIYNQNFAKSSFRRLYRIVNDPAGALDYINTYEPEPGEDKWF